MTDDYVSDAQWYQQRLAEANLSLAQLRHELDELRHALWGVHVRVAGQVPAPEMPEHVESQRLVALARQSVTALRREYDRACADAMALGRTA